MRAFSFTGKQKLKSTIIEESNVQKVAKNSLLSLGCD